MKTPALQFRCHSAAVNDLFQPSRPRQRIHHSLDGELRLMRVGRVPVRISAQNPKPTCGVRLGVFDVGTSRLLPQLRIAPFERLQGNGPLSVASGAQVSV